jgi:5'-nucleotidase
MTPRTLRRASALAVAAVALTCAPAFAHDGDRGRHDHHRGHRDRTTHVQLLAINDFHGNLEPPGGTFAPAPGQPGVPVGGIEYLATHIRQLRATTPDTVTVSAGDLIGASPLLSALFHDEPTIEGMNRLGLELNAVGNHEFDEGVDELQRMQNGGCHPTDGCLDGDGFAGARFRFLAANVVRESTGRTIFPAAAIKRFRDGVRVGFIGLTLKETPTIVSPSGVAGLRFEDEAETINRVAAQLRRRGVQSIVVLLHQGGQQDVNEGINGCGRPSGPIVDIVKRTTKAVDVFVTGHTHQVYNCVIDGRPVTSASSFGRVLTDVDLQIDRRTRDVVAVRADNKLVTRDVPKAADETALIAKYAKIAGPLRDRVIGSITADLTRAQNAAGESTLGDVIADAQLAATTGNGALGALMNPGGIRDDLRFAPDGAEGAGNVTYGEAFTVQPFANILQTITLTGAQLDQTLEQQWCGQPAGTVRMLQVAGLTYTWDAGKPVCDRVDLASIRLGGQPVTATGTYRITVNNFLADGGDGFAVLTEGTNRLGGAVDVDAFASYLATRSPLPVPAGGRITVTP